MTRLSLAAGARPSVPRDRLGDGVVHLGLGAFARAHTAVLTEDAMLATSDTRWGITGVTQTSDTVVRQLAPQDGLFTLVERGEGARAPRLVSSVSRVLAGRTDSDAVVSRIASPRTSVVTLTVTEKGYRARSGRLDLDDALVRADLAGSPPVTAVGQIARGLQRRASAGAGPISVVPCDNLPSNGALTRTLVLDFVAALPASEAADLPGWIAEHVRFPSTMVDRMVPATTPADLDAIERETGFRDEGGVVAEPFAQWVIEDSFAADRPAWEAAGAQLTADVEPWESAKLRLLNASHSLLAYLGLAAGLDTIAETVRDPAFRLAAERMMAEDALPTIVLPDRLDGADYSASVLRRFANPALGHTTAKVGADGSQKIPLRLLSTVRACRASGREPRWAALGVAAWMHRVATAAVLDDPLADQLRALLPEDRSAGEVVPALLRSPAVFGPDLADDPAVTALLVDWYGILDRRGAQGIREEIGA
ncbi:mannitol dehydrogenase family protein [Rathayibacter caricis]|uniref:mannitol dehydrogenase family protein n=1 Tax=Rathayibacter caricis TaxID=110936 RepID=UPI001FB3CC8C|nr:mannitol dehydrogenase family protein [Rathayibacter caricis]MCJ1696085.1 mannitol dehydrogenase family protein [Rathayibacter caricis]